MALVDAEILRLHLLNLQRQSELVREEGVLRLLAGEAVRAMQRPPCNPRCGMSGGRRVRRRSRKSRETRKPSLVANVFVSTVERGIIVRLARKMKLVITMKAYNGNSLATRLRCEGVRETGLTLRRSR